MKDEDVRHMVDAVNETGRGLTPWEVGFMESVTDFVDRGGKLNQAQQETLERIYANTTP